MSFWLFGLFSGHDILQPLESINFSSMKNWKELQSKVGFIQSELICWFFTEKLFLLSIRSNKSWSPSWVFFGFFMVFDVEFVLPRFQSDRTNLGHLLECFLFFRVQPGLKRVENLFTAFQKTRVPKCQIYPGLQTNWPKYFS